MTGWQRECLGDKLAEFVAGKLGVTVRMESGDMRAAFGE
jgi:hypothetical protein